MWYLLIGSISAGAASTLYALWRAAKAESRAIKAETRAAAEIENANRWKVENEAQRNAYVDQLARKEAEINVLRTQRKDALDALERSPCPGALRDSLRVSLGIK